MSEGTRTRAIKRRIKAHRQTEGAGFVVRRPIPTFGLDVFDPFLLIDEMGPVEYGPGEAVGAPDHPHRGFETVTYMLDGEGEHEDSAGHRGVIGPGAVQWMTAGSGVVHSELPSRRLRELGGKMHGFQIWVNLPSHKKMSAPRYQELSASDIPKAASDDGLAQVSVIAGEALGVHASIDTHTPIVYQDWTLEPGADVSVHIPSDHNVCAYVFRGEANLGSELERVSDGELCIFGAGDTVRLASKDTVLSARLLLLGGRPIEEPVARYGPFVMNTKQELIQAFADYEAGKMGRIVRTP